MGTQFEYRPILPRIIFWAVLFLRKVILYYHLWVKETAKNTVHPIKHQVKTLERCQWRRSSICFANCEHISNFALIVYFDQASVFWVQSEKTYTFEDKIGYIMPHVAASVNKIY